MSRAGRRGGRFVTIAALGLALYAVALLANPLLHHDLDCHLKAPGHCSACIANPLGSRAEVGGAPGKPTVLSARHLDSATLPQIEAPYVPFSAGRAPPAL